ncbi:Ubiquitin-conjugating enzyme E2 W [Trichinella pseudospiralis]|uniref:N-terminal E2 ubiquitin-conjugating enzyme n=2 Tax=Trichinella pseudospiralis TaxID=6337 RepID=A0A0V1EQE1_TRIPS|nr:Ubiquitin-conjugating enzyme E2 W [Trichinella pseudospiralis]KRY75962.1 Ubiquitin-conjugating enzyme E2 W [Trichinella pseudospiralis]KRY83634.1 Ubiquitin-conjugating enzyme E2 W [Trichinella pseudospiralis]KRZ25526.1 Ubiquitin-conjugating enzyme E2 W [Trichinella pseudospiralis]KRZ40674.1 Ubiquitin-conjugating enzyme E2 W [Trichinella pseudospiralis]
MSNPLSRRLQKEISQMRSSPTPGISMTEDQDNMNRWIVEMDGAPGTLYAGEKFKLQFIFGDNYPFSSPQVVFIGPNIPVHPHVYSNGHICLSILGEDWTPALGVHSVCLSILSMLSSCKEKKEPPDNAVYVLRCSQNPKHTSWWYHDEDV